MKVKIVERKHNPLMKREELDVHIDHTGASSPSKAALQEFLAKDLGKESNKIEIRDIYTAKGAPTAKSRVFIWEDKTISNVKKKKEKGKKGEK
jgi:ribosomal protein S24E